MKRPLPAHGTEARYQGSTTRPPCRCRTCITGWTQAGQRRQLARLQGRPASIPSAAVTAHIKTLIDSDMSAGQIAAAAGVNTSTVCEHAEGRWLKIRRTTAEKILAVQPGQYGNLGQVPALGTRRRLQALYAIGYGVTILAAATDLTANGIAKITYGQVETVSARTHRIVADAYRRLSRTPGPSHRARQRAEREGWASPAAWDDNIDDPAAQPDIDQAPEAPQAGRDPYTADEIRHLASFGVPIPEIASRVHRSENYVQQIVRGWESHARRRYEEAA